MDAFGKFGEHEISFLSVLQTLQMHPQLDIRTATGAYYPYARYARVYLKKSREKNNDEIRVKK